MMVLGFVRHNWMRIAAILLLAAAVYVYLKLEGSGSAAVCSAIVFVALVGIWCAEIATSHPVTVIVKSGAKHDFDWATHYFRGYAIMCIVISHWLGCFGYFKIKTALFYSSTIFFLFISGYLCQYIYARRPVPPARYYQKKLTNVISPFVFCTVLTVLAVYSIGIPRYAVIDPMRNGVAKTIYICAMGGAQTQYWYIPFVSGLFLVSPWLCRLSNIAIVATFLGSFIVSIVIPSRQEVFVIHWPQTLYLYTYFTCYYVLGFVYCRFKDTCDEFIRRFWWMFFAGSVFIACSLCFPDFLRLHFVEHPLLISMQRLCSIGVALFCLNLIKDMRIAVLDMLAKYSFTIYFIHYFFISDFVRVAGNPSWWKMLSLLALFFCLLLGTSALAKKAFGRWSRMFIGS